MERNDLTIVAQGRLHRHVFDHLRAYLGFARQVIISCWADDDLSQIDAWAEHAGIGKIPVVDNILRLDLEPVARVASASIARPLTSPVVVVRSGPVEVVDTLLASSNCGDHGNVYRQCISTLAGLERTTTAMAIKLRADEYYEDLSVVLARMAANPNKIVTNNIFFLRDHIRKFHASDHLMGGSTQALTAMFGISKQRCETASTFLPGVMSEGVLAFLLQGTRERAEYFRKGGTSAEQILTTSFLLHKGLPLDLERSRELTQEHFDVVPLASLGRYVWRHATKALKILWQTIQYSDLIEFVYTFVEFNSN